MEALVPPNATRRLAKDQPEYAQLSVADVVVFNNPEVRPAQAQQLLLPGEVPAMHTIWQPSPEDIAILMRGGHIHLTIIGRSFPPVCLEVHERPRPAGQRYVTTTNDMTGHFAVVVIDGPDGLDVDTTGTGRYETQAKAEEEANTMSQLLGIPFRKATA